MYQTVIDYDIPIADYTPTFVSLEERVKAALASLIDTDSVPDKVSDTDANTARSIFTGTQNATDEMLSSSGVVAQLSALLGEYDRVIVKSAVQLRTYITNRLIIDSDNPDPRIRLKAYEMLGKISDVGLFTDKTEITMRHRPTEELEQLLRERLTRVIEGDVVESPMERAMAPIAIDVSEIRMQDSNELTPNTN
jgi:hypothetical protein